MADDSWPYDIDQDVTHWRVAGRSEVFVRYLAGSGIDLPWSKRQPQVRLMQDGEHDLKTATQQCENG